MDPLKPGDKFGDRFTLLSKLGSGGMGDVWKARDTVLDRDVALKVSKDEFTARFKQEARTIAAFNHPNICQIYDVGSNYIVMELIDGVQLSGPLPVDKAVAYAGQILDALDAAHRKKFTHRDLKPANVMAMKSGIIKLLDFGLAKQQPAELGPDDETRANPKGFSKNQGIVGTLQYMSPEQLQGKDADARSDIFAFGCVLYEMLSGRKAFSGSTTASVIAAIMEREPEPLQTTPPLDRVIKTCLAKEPDERFQTARDLKKALLWAVESVVPAAEPAKRIAGGKLSWVVAAGLALTAGLVSFLHYGSGPAGVASQVSFQIVPPAIVHYNDFSLSPDGRRLAFSAQGLDGAIRLSIRNLDSLVIRAIPEAEGVTRFFWSADSRSIAFASEGKLKKIDLAGGSPQNLCDWPAESGAALRGSWGKDGQIVFRLPSGVIRKVSSSGGPCTDVARGAPTSLLPDGTHFLYWRDATGKDPAGSYAGALDSAADQPAAKLVLKDRYAWYVPSSIHSGGYLAFYRDNSLVAQPFDPGGLKVTGEPFLVGGPPQAASLIFDFSGNGILAWSTNSNGRYQLLWYDRKGKVLGSVGDPGDYGDVNLAPDDKQAAIHNRGGLDDLWLFEFARGMTTRLTSAPGRDHKAVWSPDGNRIVWSRESESGSTMYVKAVNGEGGERALPGENPTAWDWSPDGRLLAFSVNNRELKFLPLNPDGTPAGPAVPYFNGSTPSPASHVRFSPNDRWIAYTMGPGAEQEVYAGPFPAPPGGGSRWTISSGGGYQPLWRRDGRELFYFSRDGKLMSVDVDTTGTTLQFGTPKPLFEARIAGGPSAAPTHRWDVTSDGQRFLINTQLDAAASPPITVLTDWEAGLRK